MPNINIDHDLDTFSDEAKAQLQSLQFVDAELARLTAVLQTARVAYSTPCNRRYQRPCHQWGTPSSIKEKETPASAQTITHLPTSLNVEERRSDVGESEVSIVAMSAGNAAGSEGAPF
jgi:hypothetical protein